MTRSPILLALLLVIALPTAGALAAADPAPPTDTTNAAPLSSAEGEGPGVRAPLSVASATTAPDAPASTTGPDGPTPAGGGPTTQPNSAGLVRLKLVLPKPAFAGTPKNIPPGTTVEKPSGKPRPPFLVPAGVTNLGRNKPVTVSDKEPVIGEPPMITDGDKEAADGSYIELGPMVQWAQVDLGRPVEIYAVLLWHYHGDPRVYHDVVVQVADDPDFLTNVRTLFNNDRDNSAGLGVGRDREYFETFEGKLIPGGKAKARYVRLTSNGCTASEMNRYTEVEVYALPAD